MATYLTPGVYKEEIFPEPAATLQTGVPAFLGYTHPIGAPQHLTLWPQFEQYFGPPLADGYLGHAVRGFFENGGLQCYVVPLDERLSAVAALEAGLALLAPLDTIDLVCAPDLMRAVAASTEQPIDLPTLQGVLLDHCDSLGDRFALLDAVPGGEIETVLVQRQALHGQNGALYFPWVDIGLREETGQARYVPPCGHVAGVYARSDDRIGIHKAPANEILEGVLDLESNLTDIQQGLLNPVGVNALRAFPGRGIRVWGARTISADVAWTYISVRRLFLTVGRWIERNLSSVVFEPNDPALWARITRELTAYCNTLFQQGALGGNTPARAFYIKCDAALNPPAVRDLGQVITEIGLAPAVPGEFIVVRIIHSASGVTVSGPA